MEKTCNIADMKPGDCFKLDASCIDIYQVADDSFGFCSIDQTMCLRIGFIQVDSVVRFIGNRGMHPMFTSTKVIPLRITASSIEE